MTYHSKPCLYPDSCGMGGDETICINCLEARFMSKSNWTGSVPITYTFTIEEIQTLYKLIEHEYIPYNNEAAHALINKIGRILREYDKI